jgi:type III restriction enzyme
MATFNPLHFQNEAVDSLTTTFIRLWKNTDRQLPIVFKSPTGSGKTLTVAHFIKGLNHLPQWQIDKAFVWITFSDDLAMQSKDKFKEYFTGNLENGLLTVNDLSRGKLLENDILFLNWQKVVSRAAENKLLRRPVDDKMHKEKGDYFEDIIDGTKKEGREIILIIDEAHTHKSTDLAQEIIDYIDPKVIIHITATPDIKDVADSATLGSFIQVERAKVVDAGLIKEKILVQTEEDLKKQGGKDLDGVLLRLGMAKRLQIKAELKALGKEINPLMLIQLPNDDKLLIAKGDKTKEQIVSDFLAAQGVKVNQIARWFDNKKENLEFIAANDCGVDFLVFKQAAGTGWDCPRAYVLVMFREIKSDKFYTQTLGRIYRMPEPSKKEDYKNKSSLRTGYLYTNYNRAHIVIPDTEKNKILSQHAFRKQGIKNVQMKSAYVSRVDYGDIPASYKFQDIFKKALNEHFKITEADLRNKKLASAKLAEAGIDLECSLTNSIIADAAFNDFDQLAYEFRKKGISVDLEMSKHDVEKTFNYVCLQLLGEQTEPRAKYTNVARAWGVLKSAIRVWFQSVIESDSDCYYRIFISDIRNGASSKFRPAITKALIDYKPTAEKILNEKKEKQETREAPTFEIIEQYDFTDDYEIVPQTLCALDKCFLLKHYNGKENETNFIKYLESKGSKIIWWFKNGDQGKDYFAIKYNNSVEEKEGLFYPDWIIRFKNGTIGIFDTKSGQTATSKETADKAEAMTARLKEFGKGFVWGIAIMENGVWYYNNSAKYSYKKGSFSDDKSWRPMEELFI